MNIIELIEGQLDDRFTAAASNETGLTEAETRTTTRAAIPALLAGLLGSISKPSGAKTLGSMLKDENMLGNVSSLLGGSGSQSMIGRGTNALTSLLGEGQLSSLANAIGGFSGIGSGQSRSLLGMLFPIVMGVLGREQRGGAANVDGIARLLSSQKREIADAMPAGVASSLRSTGMLDALEEPQRARADEPQRTRPAASTASTASTTRRRAESHPRPAQKDRNWFWPVAAGLAVLALAVWGVTQLGDDEPERRLAAGGADETTQVAAVAPSDIDLSVGGVDLRERLTSVVDRASESLGGVTDAASAEAALPTLSEANSDLDGMMPLVDQLPEPARNALGSVARSGQGRLASEIDRVESIPGIPDNVREVVRELGGKLESLAGRRRG